MTHKVNDDYWHIWSPSCFWGDQMFNLMASKQLAKGRGVVIHTDKIAWCSHTKQWYPMNQDIFKFWSSVDFIKGIIFDVSQRKPIDKGRKESKYHVGMTLASGPELFGNTFTHDISEDIDFSFISEFFTNPYNSESKIATFQPISILHKSKNDLQLEYISPWDKSIEALLECGYEVVAIGSKKDEKDMKQYYPKLLDKYPIVNLLGKTSMFESIDLSMNHAAFVLSCDSWSAWFGIASRKKTAVAAGKTFRSGENNLYVEALGNKDVYKLDYAYNKDACDSSLAEWIKENG